MRLASSTLGRAWRARVRRRGSSKGTCTGSYRRRASSGVGPGSICPAISVPASSGLLAAWGDGCRDGGPELPACLEVGRTGVAIHSDRMLGPAPIEPFGDRLDGAQRPRGVVVAVEKGPVGPASSGVEARVVDLVEEVLE